MASMDKFSNSLLPWIRRGESRSSGNGATQAMVIKAELNVADASRVKTGARVTIKSEAWQGEMAGSVTRIDPRVERSDLTALSTFANVDRQIIKPTMTVTIATDRP